ncbi:MAG: phosphotransferase [Anaerolineaceae bacterium]
MSPELSALPEPVSGQERRSIVEVLERYGLTLTGDPTPVAESVLNRNFALPTSDGPRFVRFHAKSRTKERLELEITASAFAGSQGIPVVAALTDSKGRQLHSLSNRLWSVYPWVEGRHLQRGAIDVSGATMLGELHGRLHAALHPFTDPRLRSDSNGSVWDASKSLDDLGRVDDLIRYSPSPGKAQLILQEEIREIMALIDSPIARPAADFAGVARAVCHGDFHERNVILGAPGELVAVVDWEAVALLPPVFEVLRATSFMHLLGPGLLEAYMGGYRRHAPLHQCAEGVEMWWQSQLHNTWVYTARFIEGNRAVGQFLEDHFQMITMFKDPAFRHQLAVRLRE